MCNVLAGRPVRYICYIGSLFTSCLSQQTELEEAQTTVFLTVVFKKLTDGKHKMKLNDILIIHIATSCQIIWTALGIAVASIRS